LLGVAEWSCGTGLAENFDEVVDQLADGGGVKDQENNLDGTGRVDAVHQRGEDDEDGKGEEEEEMERGEDEGDDDGGVATLADEDAADEVDGGKGDDGGADGEYEDGVEGPAVARQVVGPEGHSRDAEENGVKVAEAGDNEADAAGEQAVLGRWRVESLGRCGRFGFGERLFRRGWGGPARRAAGGGGSGGGGCGDGEEVHGVAGGAGFGHGAGDGALA
jgi:hypothetical protein